MTKRLKIGGACLNQIPIDWEHNTRNIKHAIKAAKKAKVDVLCLPELCVTGYGCEDLFLNKWLTDKALELLLDIATEATDIAVTIGLPYRIRSKVYNTTCLIVDSDIVGFYAKQKLAIDGVHYESRWFTPWEFEQIESVRIDDKDIPFGHISHKLNDINIGFEICEDAWQEDRPASYLSEDIDLILNPSASHFAFEKAKFREELVKKSSYIFDCVYLYCNLLGNEAGRMIYDGDILAAQKGKLIMRNRRLRFEDFRLLSVDVDFSSNTSGHEIKEDFSDQNEEFAHAAGLALFDYLRKSKSKGFVLSLSGGADSSSIAVLVHFSIKNALEQLGRIELERKIGFKLKGETLKDFIAELLTVAYQGTVNSSKNTFNSADYLAKSLGAKFYHWEIDSEVGSYTSKIEKVLGRDLKWSTDDLALQNIQARARSPIIWMLTNIKNALLLATSNRSEGDVGYATMDGDTSGSISPISGVSKYFILQWLQYAQNELGYVGLSEVNSLTPTAELRPENRHQTDEEDLMPYEVLQAIEIEAILKGKSPKQVVESLNIKYDLNDLIDWVLKFFQLWSRNQWKRERYAPSFHFDAFNIDPRSGYRFPILNSGFKTELKELMKLKNI